MSGPEPIVVTGSGPLVLVAPHGGQRDYERRPWGGSALKVNDIQTASLTQELVAMTGASAVINAHLDRNDVDLNRVSAAHEHAPVFLERLAEVLEDTVARHGRATVLTVHGWNVIQPAVDLGFGCARGVPVDRAAAVSPAFAAAAVPALVSACAARGIAATLGARYPARGRENLVQLFTPRYRNDGRGLVRRLATLGMHADALQLELGVPLRWPGAWRRRLIEACSEALPALVGPADGAPPADAGVAPSIPALRRTLEIAGQGTSTLVAQDQIGARLLLPAPGDLALFTGEAPGGRPGRWPGCGSRMARRRTARPLRRPHGALPRYDLRSSIERGLHSSASVLDC